MARAPFTAADLETARRRFDRLNQSLVTLEDQLDSTGLPVHLWPPKVQKFYTAFTHQVTRAQRSLLRLAQALAAAAPKADPSSEPEPAAEAESPRARTQYQNVRIAYIDGKAFVSAFAPTNKFLLKYLAAQDPPAPTVTRMFTFDQRIVPEEYYWIRDWEGEQAPLAAQYQLTYAREEYIRMAHQELENPGSVVDGERLASGYILSWEDEEKRSAEIARKREEARLRELEEWNS